MSSRQLEELNEEKDDKHIANLLGISAEDYNKLIHKGVQDETGEDGIVYRHYIKFEDESPKQILKKIKDLDLTNTVYFDISDFIN